MKPLNPEFAKVRYPTKSGDAIPVIDFEKFRTAELIAKEIGGACEAWGFFQIVNHGINSKTIKNLWSSAQNFFSLPKDQKRSLNRTSNSPWGYFDHELTKNKRDKKQWTLDRIDNSIGHNTNNLVISCLECNIQKRDRNHEQFLFSKNMKIDKLS